MKLNLSRARQRGNLLLGLLALALLAIIIGLAVYAIYKALTHLPPRHIDPDDVNYTLSLATNEIPALSFPAEGYLSDGSYFVKLASITNIPTVHVQRSTNLVNWETVAQIGQNEIATWVDTNPPFPCGFYRIIE